LISVLDRCFRRVYVSFFRKSALLFVAVAMLAGCSKGNLSRNQQPQVTSDTLIGRWSVLPKDLADENPGADDVRGPAGEITKFRWQFKKDQTFEMSVDAKVGRVPELDRKATSSGTWKVLEVRGDTLVIELSRKIAVGRATVVFQSQDRCTYDAGEGEVFVLTRLP
jgi:hypothetical protein